MFDESITHFQFPFSQQLYSYSVQEKLNSFFKLVGVSFFVQMEVY